MKSIALALVVALVASYTYDDASRVATVTRPGSLLTEIGYDELDRPTAVSHSRLRALTCS